MRAFSVFVPGYMLFLILLLFIVDHEMIKYSKNYSLLKTCIDYDTGTEVRLQVPFLFRKDSYMIIVIILCLIMLIIVCVFRFIKRKAKEYKIKCLKEYSRKSNYERMNTYNHLSVE